ncbi:ABC transporter transmembrane domain-containing protein [Rhizobiaceae bacterium n13]|uniref:ABC transporter transmembrane domain-containing protein n=1 Tax=Ferirhizobium litorale TaxID=2927786 RepID=A0AAE3QDK3_9HYPH|nr:ABC transporter transmembrane domain-containing protein [Fererhizobium litorale]MDI7861653.1 ABC transporter transmembrane domain-containing protein [Fererhizobium litorale]MDI7922005.1 ABC transporter transmembrane domain-containing protein [Fererhizobium litorale]
MEKRLISYIWTHTRKQQLWILLVVAVSMIPYFMSFDLPKQIVNGPIQGQGFESEGATQTFMRIAFDLPYLGNVVVFPGLELTRIQTLYALSLVFLALVVINGLFKLYINTYKGRLGERLLRRIRFDLIDRVLRFPPNQFKRVKGAEIASMVKDEVEPLGGFTGDAFVQPALLGGQAVTALVFIILQNYWLGLMAALIVAVQAIIIPKMRKRLLVLGRERQLTARELSGRVGEIVDGISTIHSYDTSNFERADISARLGRIFKIRYDLYQWKFMVKFLNNFLAQVTPFLFYCIGGYLALNGRLDIGQLVAVIGAYKDLPGPLKELIDWDQSRQDVQIKFVQVVEQFNVDNMIDPEVHKVIDGGDVKFKPPLAAVNLTLVDDSGARLLERVSLQIQPGEKVAMIGGEALAEAFARINWPESGKVVAGGEDLLSLPEAVTGRHISYVSSEFYIFQGTLWDNLLYGLKHAPVRPASYDATGEAQRRWAIEEARLAGNPVHDINSDWIDYESALVTGPDELYSAVHPVLDAVMLTNDIMDLALRSAIDPATHETLAARIVEMRKGLRDTLEHEGLDGLIVPFELNSYNIEATVGENLLFGTATGPDLIGAAIAKNEYFREVLSSTGLHKTLFAMGYEIAENAIELFGDLPPDHPFFQQLTFMTAEDIPEYQLLLQKLSKGGFDAASEEERYNIIRLSFAYIEPRHRFGLLDKQLMDKIVEARRKFHDELPEELQGQIERYDPDRYMASATLRDNVLFGRISQKHSDGAERIRKVAIDLFNERGLEQMILAVGLEFDVGAGGKRLTSVQRLKLNLARALVRNSTYFILNRPLPGLDARIQDHIVRDVIDLLGRRDTNPAIVWVLSNPSLANLFDRVVVFDRGVLVEDGTHETLAEKGGIFKELLSS